MDVSGINGGIPLVRLNEPDDKYGNENLAGSRQARTNLAAQGALRNLQNSPVVLNPVQQQALPAQNPPIVLSPAPPDINLNPLQNINLTPVNSVKPFSETVITEANQLFLDARKARNEEFRSSLKKWVITGLVICTIAAAILFTGGIAVGGVIMGIGVLTALIPSSIRYGIHREGDTKKLSAAEFEHYCSEEYDKLVKANPNNAIPSFLNYFQNKKEGLNEDTFEEFCQELYTQARLNPSPQMVTYLQTIRTLEEKLDFRRTWEFEYLNKEFTSASRETLEIAKNPERLEFKEMCEAREDPNSAYMTYVNATWNLYQLSANASPKKDKISDVYQRFKNVADTNQASKDIRLYRLFKEKQDLDTRLNSPDPAIANAAQATQQAFYKKQDDLFAYYGKVLIAPRSAAP